MEHVSIPILERNTRSLFVINSLQLTSFAPMEFTVLGDRPEREREGGGRLSRWRSGTRNLSPSPSIFLFVPRPGEMPSQPASQSRRTGREKWSKNFLEIDRTRLLRVSGHGWYTHHRRVVDKLSSRLRFIITMFLF